jgi:hypothetical protein
LNEKTNSKEYYSNEMKKTKKTKKKRKKEKNYYEFEEESLSLKYLLFEYEK